jgi:ABC-type multidrug transport system ATPase subunit
MAAGHFSSSQGRIHVAGCNMDTGAGSRAARKRTGYCPQDNALLEMMTTREHLYFYSSLKGVPSNMIPEVTEAKLQQMGLKSFEHNYAANLSGGNKRKLMVACALIGDPPIILADEPSAGMDPVARRFMWSVIQNVATKRKRSSVLLSTHSMEECEALCTRSCIMVNGVFRTLGTNRAICERYGGGFDLMVKIQRPSEEELQSAVASWGIAPDADEVRLDVSWANATFQSNPFAMAALAGSGSPFVDWTAKVTPKVMAEWWVGVKKFHALHQFVPQLAETVELVEWHSPMARYKLMTKKSLGELFAEVEKSKQRLDVLEYSISATTLEQIFNSFARWQESQDTQTIGPLVVTEDMGRYLQVANETPLQEGSTTVNLNAAVTEANVTPPGMMPPPPVQVDNTEIRQTE